MNPSDADLLRQASQGDDSAFATLVDRHAPMLHRVAVGMIGNRTDADDLLQETFHAAWLGMKRFRGEASVKTWLTRILILQTARLRRWQRLRRYLPWHGLDTEAPPPAATTDDPTPAIDARLDLADLLRQLSDEHRQVLLLREIQGLSYDEIARTLDLPRGTVESRLFRARAALKSHLEQSQATGRGNAATHRPPPRSAVRPPRPSSLVIAEESQT